MGSSSKINGGSEINSTPIAVLFLSPPEIVFFKKDPIYTSAVANNPKSFSNYSTFKSNLFHSL